MPHDQSSFHHSVTNNLDNTTAGPTSEPIRPWSSLLIRDYRLIFITILCGNTANHMRNVASLYQVYQLSGSSIQLGFTGFFQAMPFIFFGLFGGVLADSLNRKRLISITHTLNVLPGLALGDLDRNRRSASLARQCFERRGGRRYRSSEGRRAKRSSRASCRNRISSMQSPWPPS